MAALLVEVKAGRIGDGIVAAVGKAGVVLAEHFPKTG
jgi:putative membrane protein